MGITAASAQLNVRMSKELKDKGEVELAEAGYSPSEFIRIVWNGVAKGARVIQQIVDVAEPSDNAASLDATTRRIALLETGQRLYDEGLSRLGLSGGNDVVISEEEMDQARFDYLFSKGQ